jgi:hypothetical protein
MRALVCGALLLLLPIVTADHAAHLAPAAGASISAHGHGPHAPCPPAPERHCLACATAALLAPAPDIERLTPPARASSLAETDPADTRDPGNRAEVGRGPPSV